MLLNLDNFLNYNDELDSLDVEKMLEHLVVLNQIKRDIADIYESFSKKVMEKMEEKNISEIDVAGASVQKKTASPRKSWDHKSLMEATYDRISQSSVDMDTGEVVLSSREIAIKMLEYFNPSYWRVKELSKIGINADQFCEVGEEKTNIAIYMKGTDK
jgi:hypothetical protein